MISPRIAILTLFILQISGCTYSFKKSPDTQQIQNASDTATSSICNASPNDWTPLDSKPAAISNRFEGIYSRDRYYYFSRNSISIRACGINLKAGSEDKCSVVIETYEKDSRTGSWKRVIDESDGVILCGEL